HSVPSSNSLGGVNFGACRFWGEARFGGAFTGPASFSQAGFSNVAVFNNARFANDVNFSSAVFATNADFKRTKFHGRAGLGATFNGPLLLWNAGHDYQDKAYFFGDADFRLATFKRSVNFRGVEFHQSARFASAEFDGPASFGYAHFFHEVTFYNERGYG